MKNKTLSTVTGPATWNPDTHQIELTGAPSGEFSTEQGATP